MVEDLDRLGAVLGDRYGDVRFLAEGGMARVYAATDLRHQRRVAIKVFRPEIGSTVAHSRFHEEIRIAAQLQHPNIVPVYDSGADADLLYYLMPLIEGESLRDKLNRDGPLPISEVFRITQDIASALSFAHKRGIVHRDVKPGNILLAEPGAMILDFGIARAVEEAGGEELTRTGVSVGTPSYMSPEQCTGEPSIDGRSDEYSLACVAYEMLTGEPPFTGPTGRIVMAKHAQERPPSVEIARPDLPLGVGDTLAVAMAKTPADRFPTVIDFCDSLTGRTGAPKSPRTRAQDARRAHLPRVLVRGLVGLLTLIALVLVIWAVATGGPLDPNTVLLLPLEDSAAPAGRDVGIDVVANIGYVLDGTDPLRWVEGREVMDDPESWAGLSHASAARLARRSGASFFMNGSILRTGDSVSVVLRLYDARSRELIQRAGRTGPPAPGAELSLGAEAAKELISGIIEPGRPIDVAAISLRSGVALTRFHLGEVAYRDAHFSEALRHYESTLREDSTFALAAVRGAQAASWIEQAENAARLSELAVRQDSLLPPKYRQFAWGIRYYDLGMADSAMARYREALAYDPRWVEALVAMGEVHYHRLLRGAESDSLAASEFRQALEVDPAFHLPAYHLAEMAVRQGRLGEAERLIQGLEEVNPDPVLRLQLELMLRCARAGPEDIDWNALAQADSVGLSAVLDAAQSLSAGGAYLTCSEAGARAALAASTSASQRWGALLLLHNILLSQGRSKELKTLVASEGASGLPGSRLFLLDGTVDDAYREEAEKEAQALLEVGVEGNSSPNLWLLGQWAGSVGNRELLAGISSVLAERAASTGARRDHVIAQIMEARLALLDEPGDRAVQLLQALEPSGTLSGLVWDPWEAMIGEKLALAEILLDRGEFKECVFLASEADSHRAVVNLVHLPRSLEIRARATEAMGDSVAAENYRMRLEELGHDMTN